MSEQTRPKKRRTLIKFAVQKSVYEAGVGNTTEWDFITSTVGKDSNNGNEITTDCFYCEWLNSYGTVAISRRHIANRKNPYDVCAKRLRRATKRYG